MKTDKEIQKMRAERLKYGSLPGLLRTTAPCWAVKAPPQIAATVARKGVILALRTAPIRIADSAGYVLDVVSD
jgi:hypothetical protein